MLPLSAAAASFVETGYDAIVFDEGASRTVIDRLWEEILMLQPRQRTALLCGLEREDVLALAGTFTAFAEAIEAPVDAAFELWPALPLTDRAIGELVGATTQQVSNLRKCARERLRRRLGEDLKS